MMRWITRMRGFTVAMDQGNDNSPTDGTAPLPTPLSDGLLIDVRSSGEFSSGHIAGAISMPLDRLQTDIFSVAPDKGTPLLLYCRSGARSARACQILSSLGHRSVRNGGGIASLALQLGRMVNRT